MTEVPERTLNPETMLGSLHLSTRARKAICLLFSPRTSTHVAVGELSTVRAKDFKKHRNCGDQTVQELRSILKRAGMTFSDEKPHMPGGQAVGNQIAVTVCLFDKATPDRSAVRVRIIQQDDALYLILLDANDVEIARTSVTHVAGVVAATVRPARNRPLVLVNLIEPFNPEVTNGTEEDRTDHQDTGQVGNGHPPGPCRKTRSGQAGAQARS